MIIGLVRKLGEIKIEESDSILLETYINAQNPYKHNHIFSLEVDLETGQFRIVTEEYDPSKELVYLRGIQGGNSENLSPAMNLKPTELMKNREKVLNTGKFPSRTTLFEKQVLDPDQFPIYAKLIDWFESNKKTIRERLLDKLENEYYDSKTKKMDRNTPTLIVFKVKQNGTFLYPGEIDEFRHAYLQLATPPPPKDAITGTCMACALEKPLTPTEKLNTSLFEFFSLDLNNFVMGMDLKKSNQLTICLECQELLKLGLSVLDNELKFRAYTRKIDSKNTLFVDHSLLPTAYGKEAVGEVIKSLRRIRRDKSEAKRNSLRREIQQLQDRLHRVDRKQQRELKKKLKDAEATLNKVKDLEEVDERIVLEQFVSRGISYIDLYYTNEMVGVGNFKKVFMDLTFVNADFLRKLMKSIKDLEQDFHGKGLMKWKGETYRFEFANLYTLFSIKIADLVRKAMLTGVKVSASELSRDALRNLRDPFLKLNAKIDKPIWINKKEYNNRLNTFLFVYQLLNEMQLLKE